MVSRREFNLAIALQFRVFHIRLRGPTSPLTVRRPSCCRSLVSMGLHTAIVIESLVVRS